MIEIPNVPVARAADDGNAAKEAITLQRAADARFAPRFAEAAGCYRTALRLNGQYADAHFYLAITLEKTGHSLEAKPHWRAYQTLAPDGEWVELAREFFGFSDEQLTPVASPDEAGLSL